MTWKWFPGFLYQTVVRGREQDSRETERESVLEAECCGEREMALAIKYTAGEKHVVRMCDL
jgi:hypothetical protein